MSSRSFVKTLVAFALLLTSISITVCAQEIKVTLLGTGSPPPIISRFGPSILVEAGGKKFLFDAGRGAIQRLNQLDVKWQDIDGVFFTHLHSDHVVGFPDAWLTGWLVNPGRNRPLSVWGPPGTQNLMTHLTQAFEFDIKFRISDDKASAEGAVIRTEEIPADFVYEQGGLKITAIKVDHAPVEPAYGYRIDFGGRAVVLSGDTRLSENLQRHAAGVDLLVHEVVAPGTFAAVKAERAQTVMAHHVTPEQAGEVFSKAKPKLAVYSHIVQPTATAEELIQATRRTYQGRVEVGEDLMVITVGQDVVVRRPR
jgi:ribonuclease Z